MLWVVCYDITNNKRRTKVMKKMEGHGRRVQFSVFECDLSPDKIQRLATELLKLINPDQDSIRIYPLNEGDLKKALFLGVATLVRPKTHYII